MLHCPFDRSRVTNAHRRVGSGRQAKTRAVHTAKGTSHRERSRAIGISSIHTGTGEQAKPGTREAAKGAGHDQRRRTLAVRTLHVRAIPGTQPRTFVVTLVATRQKGRPSICSGNVDTRTFFQQERCAVGPVEHAARVQRSAAIPTLVIGGGACVNEQLCTLEVPVHAGNVQRVAAKLIDEKIEVAVRIFLERISQVARRSRTSRLQNPKQRSEAGTLHVGWPVLKLGRCHEAVWRGACWGISQQRELDERKQHANGSHFPKSS